MAGQPYNIILAGKYGVGKSSLFSFLSREQSHKSIRAWDKWEHVMSVGKEQVQVFEICSRSKQFCMRCSWEIIMMA